MPDLETGQLVLDILWSDRSNDIVVFKSTTLKLNKGTYFFKLYNLQ